MKKSNLIAILKWAVFIFSLFSLLVSLAEKAFLSTVFFLLLSLLSLPLLSEFWRSKVPILKNKIIKISLLFVLFILGCIFSPPQKIDMKKDSVKKKEIKKDQYEITSSEKWDNGGQAFKVRVDSVLTQKDALRISNKIKKDSIKSNIDVIFFFYAGNNYDTGQTQNVAFKKGDSYADYTLVSVSNREIKQTKKLTLDDRDKKVIASYLWQSAGIKFFIYQYHGKYFYTHLSAVQKEKDKPVEIQPHENNTAELYQFTIKEGIDEGMGIKIDKVQKYVEILDNDYRKKYAIIE